MIPVFLCAAILGFSGPPMFDPQVFGDRDPSTALEPSGRGGYMSLRIFSGALTRRELAGAIFNLPISEDTRQILVNCAKENYQPYLTEHDDVVSRHVGKYLGIASALADQYKATHESPTVEQIRERTHEADAIERELISAEKNFIQSMQECFDNSMVDAGMSDVGKESIGGIILESLRLRADRRYSNTWFRVPQRGTAVDLRFIVDQLRLDMPIRKPIEADLLDYERSLSALKPAQCKAFWGVSLRMRVLSDQAAAGKVDEATTQSQMNKIPAVSANIGSQIRIAALDTIVRIASKLPENQSQVFRREVYKDIYPEITDDPKGDALRAKFSSVRARMDLPRDMTEQIVSLQQSWELECNAWRSKAEASLLEWSDRGAAMEREYLGPNGKAKVDDLLQMRNEIHENWRSILENQVPETATAASSN